MSDVSSNTPPSSPSTLILSIHAQRSPSQTVLEEHFTVEPKVKATEFTPDGSDNRFVRLETGKHKTLTITYSASVDATSDLCAPDASRPRRWQS